MSKEKENNQRENYQSIGIGVENSRWITAKLSIKEITLLTGMKIALKEAGLAIPMTQIVRKILDIGIANIDVEALKIDPLSLFQVPTGATAK